MYGKIYVTYNLSFHPFLSVQFSGIKHSHIVVQSPVFAGLTFSLDYKFPEVREPIPVLTGITRAFVQGSWQV